MTKQTQHLEPPTLHINKNNLQGAIATGRPIKCKKSKHVIVVTVFKAGLYSEI